MDQAAVDHLGQAVKESKMNFRQQLQEAYEAGYRSALNEQAPILPSWSSIIDSISNHMELVSQGARPLAPALDYDGDGQVTFTDLTIALSLWSQGFMPVNAQDYQAGLLIVDESGLGEQLPPEGEELLSVLSGQGSLGMFNPMDAFDQSIRTQTGATTRRITPTGPPAPRTFNPTVSRTGPRLGMGGPPAMPGGMG